MLWASPSCPGEALASIYRTSRVYSPAAGTHITTEMISVRQAALRRPISSRARQWLLQKNDNVRRLIADSSNDLASDAVRLVVPKPIPAASHRRLSHAIPRTFGAFPLVVLWASIGCRTVFQNVPPGAHANNIDRHPAHKDSAKWYGVPADPKNAVTPSRSGLSPPGPKTMRPGWGKTKFLSQARSRGTPRLPR